jgi:tRNA isopentenyl-2-thiomethyl-A-37 hydroxylase MiaE
MTENAFRYTGQVVYVFAFDLAYEFTGLPQSLLGQPLRQFEISTSKRMPRQMFFFRPQMVRLPGQSRQGPRGPVEVERTVKLFPVGAASITFRVPFGVNHFEQLVDYHDLALDGQPLHHEARELAEQLRQELIPYSIKPVPKLAEEEAYTVFCVNAPLPGQNLSSAEAWLQQHHRSVSAVLTQESDTSHLSTQEAQESSAMYLSYYEQDLVVVDWDAALVVDLPHNFEEVLHVMELANVQLAELEAYDHILDDSLQDAYRDLKRRPLRPRNVLDQLREIRIDLARLSDELSNITKFFGDWHLARVYQHLSSRFHLADWHRTIDDKLDTLDELYQLLKSDRTNRLMMLLEVTIVLLFVIDLVILIAQLRK